LTRISLLEGSWGEGGDHRSWLNKHTDWTWDRLYDAEADFEEAVAEWRAAGAAGAIPGNAGIAERALRQAARELLLLQSSDWQFLITTGAAGDYAERRFALHYVDLKQLLDLARRMIANPTPGDLDMQYLTNLEVRDAVFANVDLAWFAAPDSATTPQPRAGGH
jgi:1,4-alpha-glucan branching enzyme